MARVSWWLNPRTWLAVGVLAVMAALFAAGWRLGSSSLRADLADTKRKHAEVMKQISEKTTKAYEAAMKARDETANVIAAMDEKHQKELTDAKAENDDLRARARAGAVVVRIPGACSAGSTSDLSGSAAPGSVGSATIGQADAQLRERIFNLREAIVEADAKIAYLQDYARACVARAEP